jgi:methionyl-tRNA formyltransferase
MFNFNYIFCGQHKWNKKIFYKKIRKFPGKWHFIDEKKKLNYKNIKSLNPKYIFFPHWSFKVKASIYKNFECINFHETNLPYGRGGSPIQNLIIRGKKNTVVCALKMTKDFDSGPIYLKRKLSLNGSAEEIFERASKIYLEMIKKIMKQKIIPKKQSGKPVYFKRRTPKESEITGKIKKINDLFNHIRMLDADGYPKSYILNKKFKFEFKNAKKTKKKIIAKVLITKLKR